MSETLAELAETDALLTALSRGDLGRAADPVLNALSSWVDEITSHPVPQFDMELPEFYARETGGRAWRVAATAIVVTAMSSSGIAAAATGDPLAPFSYVATALGHLAPSDRADQLRFGSPQPAGIERGPSSRDGAPSSAADSSSSWPTYSVETHGRHRAPESDVKPRHRAVQASVTGGGSTQATDADYTPRHIATDVGTPTTPTDAAPAETPVVTPTPETPTQPSTPPASGPETTNPDPQPVPGDGPVVALPAPSESAPADSSPTGSGATGGEAAGSAADSVQAKVSENAPTDTAVDQGSGE